MKGEIIKEFHLSRDEDVSGTSGTGIVARGVILPSGKAVMEWCTYHTSVCIYANIQDVDLIHGHSGKTKLILGAPPDGQ